MFQLLCGGPWFDRQAVMADDSIERLQREFDKCVRRPEIKITKIFSKGEWRPNIRLATRFRSGRVFIAGGTLVPFRPVFFLPQSVCLSIIRHRCSSYEPSYRWSGLE